MHERLKKTRDGRFATLSQMVQSTPTSRRLRSRSYHSVYCRIWRDSGKEEDQRCLKETQEQYCSTTSP